MELCAKQCTNSMPQPHVIQLLWSHAHKFWCQPTLDGDSLSAYNLSSNDAACLHLVKPVLKLLSALMPKLVLQPATSQNSSSGSNTDQPASKNTSHNKAAAASKAARVLQERRNAESAKRGPYPADLLYLVASALQVMDTLFGSQCGSASLSGAQLLGSLTLFKTLHTISTFLLRCVRNQALLLLVKDPSSHIDAQVQLATNQLVCYASVNVFRAVTAISSCSPHIAPITSSIPDRFFDMLGCLACEGLPADDEAGWALANMSWDSLLDKLADRHVSSLLYCPSMQLLSRRVAPHAIRHCAEIIEPRIEYVRGVIAAHHSDIAFNPLLSENFKCINIRRNLEPISITAGINPTAALQRAQSDDTCDAYYVPRASDECLQRCMALLPPRKSRFFTLADGQTRSATEGSVHLARLAAVLLSLHRPAASNTAEGRVSCVLEHSVLQHTLLAAARFSSALAIQMLSSVKTGHDHCLCGPLFCSESGSDNEEGAEARCVVCSEHTEGNMALLLQIIHLHDRQGSAVKNIAGEPNTASDFGYRSDCMSSRTSD